MKSPAWQYRSVFPGVAWPAILGPDAAASLALQFQLERSQWLDTDRLLELQFRQLGVLLGHAYGTVPYYRERWRGLYDPAALLTLEAFSRLPILTRAELQAHYDGLKSERIPPAHGPVVESRTSGSTGRPVRVLKTGLAQLMWQTMVLREHRWFRRDLAGKLAAIRQGAKEGEAEGWGPATHAVAATGRSATLPISVDVDNQLAWLEHQQPDYLLSYPSNLAELARRARARGIRFPRLREVRALGEVLTPAVREACRQAWGAAIVDSYSAQETGYLALQCPQHEHLHVQSEVVLLELLDGDGRPCAPGATGRVVVTVLHNFATPLVRYDIGDFATVGPACDCGRGLPVLEKVAGRVRNMLRLASGASYWPMLGTGSFTGIAPVLQHQFVQKGYGVLELRLVTARPLTPAEEDGLRRKVAERLPAPMTLQLVYPAELPRGAGGKFEDFICEVPERY